MDIVSYCERVAIRVVDRGMHFDVFSAHFKGKNYLKKIRFYVITSPTALDRVNPKISKTTKPLRIRIALATFVSQTPFSVASLTTDVFGYKIEFIERDL